MCSIFTLALSDRFCVAFNVRLNFEITIRRNIPVFLSLLSASLSYLQSFNWVAKCLISEFPGCTPHSNTKTSFSNVISLEDEPC